MQLLTQTIQTIYDASVNKPPNKCGNSMQLRQHCIERVSIETQTEAKMSSTSVQRTL